jgi:hypothetical protein
MAGEQSLKLPGSSEVQISRSKVIGYLLATGHPVGGAKARYLESRGFTLEAPVVLESALRRLAMDGTVITEEATRWGTKCFVVGTIDAPDGNPMTLDTVWIVDESGVATFVTAYPAWREK